MPRSMSSPSSSSLRYLTPKTPPLPAACAYCLPGRPVLSFDASFDEQPHLQLLKEMLGQVFTTPVRHHKAKPFFDHIFSFSVADGCIWMRNYQVSYPGVRLDCSKLPQQLLASINVLASRGRHLGVDYLHGPQRLSLCMGRKMAR